MIRRDEFNCSMIRIKFPLNPKEFFFVNLTLYIKFNGDQLQIKFNLITMLPVYNNSNNSLYWFQNPNILVQSYFYQNFSPFYTPANNETFYISNSLPVPLNELSQLNSNFVPIQTDLNNKQPKQGNLLQDLQALTKISKEKFIKKKPNRPATYLTQKKFYLTQTISPQLSQSGPHLRLRNIKKNSKNSKKIFDKKSEKILNCIKKTAEQSQLIEDVLGCKNRNQRQETFQKSEIKEKSEQQNSQIRIVKQQNLQNSQKNEKQPIKSD